MRECIAEAARGAPQKIIRTAFSGKNSWKGWKNLTPFLLERKIDKTLSEWPTRPQQIDGH